ncbi:hypothetical protein [Streptomyces sp. NRRL S-87]|uniref:BACON domain-containing protein n=1 Tax=Streptomyces sp. NRRL S-87 TaxID=1463920 RepID=UPI0004C2B276|nr:hypothetical protein [Streptomyces sp. NRRL S-87]
MTRSSQAQPTRSTGAHRAHGRVCRTPDERPPSRHEVHLDGLFTYCLSVMCDHDAATEALGDVLVVAERHAGRRSADAGEDRAWLYALARWACLRKLATQRRARQGAHSSRRAPAHTVAPHSALAPVGAPSGAPGGTAAVAPGATDTSDRNAAATLARSADAPGPGTAAGTTPDPAPDPAADPAALPDAAERHAELSRLAWPEAAGTTPEQREALELAVRHGLAVPEVAAVLGMGPAAARELLAGAACEVERTRAALAVVETGSCPAVSRLTDDSQVLLSSALRAELVRHVDDCPTCRRVAERVDAVGPWPGSALTRATLPLVAAPRPAVALAARALPRSRMASPRFDRTGFPMDPKDRALRRERLRARAVTTTVVATVVAAPVLALWAAYRGAPLTGEGGAGATRISAAEADGHTRAGGPYASYENAGNARTTSGPGFMAGSRSPDVSVEVISPGRATEPSVPGVRGPGRLTVDAVSSGGTTLVMLSASGGTPVQWRLWADAPWLWISSTSGTLEPGETFTVRISVDHTVEPAGDWIARLGVEPSGAVLTIEGHGPARPSSPSPSPTTASPTPSPSATTADPTPSPTPTPTGTAEPTPSTSTEGTVSPDPTDPTAPPS